MTPSDGLLMRRSLVLVWLGTALASALESHGRSAALLEAADVHSPAMAALALWGGVAFDAAMGLVLWLSPLRLAATLALFATLLMTAVTSVLLPGTRTLGHGSVSATPPSWR